MIEKLKSIFRRRKASSQTTRPYSDKICVNCDKPLGTDKAILSLAGVSHYKCWKK